MINIVPYGQEFRAPLSKLIKTFHEDTLGEYGLVMTDETIEKFEDTMGASTFVMLDDGKPIGLIAGQVVSQIMSNKKVYQEFIWYVDKDHRSHGAKLLIHLENWCAENDIDQIVMAFMHNSQPDRLMKFYERMGYRPMETHLIKEVSHG